jgi:hypothetical protein
MREKKGQRLATAFQHAIDQYVTKIKERCTQARYNNVANMTDKPAYPSHGTIAIVLGAKGLKALEEFITKHSREHHIDHTWAQGTTSLAQTQPHEIARHNESKSPQAKDPDVYVLALRPASLTV